MSEPTRIALKTLVERVVRPVKASTRCKRKIREELLAHVTAVFEEEAGKVGDDTTALARTRQRFGDAAELTRQLQEAVPAGDAMHRYLDAPPGESPWRVGIRLSVQATALALLVFAAIISLTGSNSTLPIDGWVLSVRSILLLPLYLFSMVFLADWMRRALNKPTNYPRIKTVALLTAGCVVNVLFLAGLQRLNGEWPEHGEWIRGILLTFLVAAWMSQVPYWLARTAEDRLRYHQEWASLQID